ncbi:hypothetical protein ACFVIM_11020 [Streptomyces sp. NPDC057638]|uniref:hypothetical protein n=1 Tax=Streptomyces sp. NPDC057638 TaxID=3346190 RepID=UPI00369CA524
MVGLVVATWLVAWFGLGGGGEDRNRSAGSAAPTGTDPAPEESADASGDPAGEAPSGYEKVRDPEGFTLTVPLGWLRDKINGTDTADTGDDTVVYQSPDNPLTRILVDSIDEPNNTPLQVVTYGFTLGSSDYRNIYRGRAEEPGPENPTKDAAELRYTYENAKEGVVRDCVVRVFTAANDDLYSVRACAPAKDTPNARTLLTMALRTFDPGPT